VYVPSPVLCTSSWIGHFGRHQESNGNKTRADQTTPYQNASLLPWKQDARTTVYLPPGAVLDAI